MIGGKFDLPEDINFPDILDAPTSSYRYYRSYNYIDRTEEIVKSCTEDEINQLKELGVQEYVICLDPDDAGRRGAAKLKKALSSIGLVWVVDMPDGKDLNDCTKEEFDAVYANRH